ncbi:MAG: trypsin-like peptidase domain-containing protein [Pseudonocardia sp.]|nr:trypsin-like peptidase domain-containing protein [Pseudonocardia sp.]
MFSCRAFAPPALPAPVFAPVLAPIFAAVLATVLAVAAAGDGAPASDVPPPPPATVAPGVRWPATGALFDGPPDQLGAHYCSGSVVDTPAGDVVLTAAHCVADGDGSAPRTGMSFVPGYHDHSEPFGIWTVATATVDDAWRDQADPDHDVAFLTVTRDGAPPIQHVVGAYHLDLDAGSTISVDALGYPDFAEDPLQRSGTTTRFSPTQLQLHAHGLYDGTSGSPWLRTGDTDVIAVTGGHAEGGRDPDTSYATYLGADAAALFRQAGGTP